MLRLRTFNMEAEGGDCFKDVLHAQIVEQTGKVPSEAELDEALQTYWNKNETRLRGIMADALFEAIETDVKRGKLK